VNTASSVEAGLPTAGEPEAPTASGSRPVSVAEGYERWAPTYDDAPNPLLAREERYLLPLVADLRDKSVLDLACGTGRWLERLMARGGRSVVGIDCSGAMLRVAGRKSAIRQRFGQAICENLPFRNAVFDLVVCSFALGHIRDLRSTVRELARVTKPGADVFISDLHPEAYARGWRVGFRDENTAFQIEMQPCAPEQIIQAFRSDGFEYLTGTSLWLDEPENPHFVRAGKAHLFADACQVPAVLVCHFKRRGSAIR
jgi:ubiquinone/menaquinone biosynthesis C-methylase UbiE